MKKVYARFLPSILALLLFIAFSAQKITAQSVVYDINNSGMLFNNAGMNEAELPAALLFPNPNNGNFQIQVPEGMNYLAKVFDLQGRLIDQFAVAGNTSITQDYATGKYICVLEEELSKHKIELTLVVY